MTRYDSDRPSKEGSSQENLKPSALRSIGPYKILGKLGEGGMGVVYRAKQEKPIQRQVALKVIRLGMSSKQVVARFETERQALALMNHPNIARVYDAGSTGDGLPYFVMELVQGVPITRYCDLHRLSTEERLQLFIQVCEGVHHAHQKGVIHRDLKPSNILVTIQDQQPVPKIIDFGVAKAVGQQLTEKTLFTEEGRLIGTPAYMSPEQAEMTGLDVDTRTDVYSLGALLYELLVGEKPFDLRGLPLFQIGAVIREQDPPTPSTRFEDLGDASTLVAMSRQTDVFSLRRRLRGDLDWITMKALEKDRTRRYASASELAIDISRHLKHEPVVASPPSTAYRAGKFVKRHRLGVTAGVSIVLALLVGIVGVTVGLVRASRAEKEARREALTAQKVSDFLVGIFEVSDPNEARGNTITAREVLDSASQRIKHDLDGQPLVQARLMETIGNIYSNLGLFDSALPLLERSLQLRQELLADDHPDLAQSLSSLAKLHALGNGDYDKAEQLLRRAVAIQKEVPGPDTSQLALYLNHLAIVLRSKGNNQEAKDLLRRALLILEQSPGSSAETVGQTLGNLATVHLVEEDLGESEALFKRALAIQEKALGPDHPRLTFIVHNLAMVYDRQEQYDQAEHFYLRSLQIEEKSLGPDHPNLGLTLSNLGSFYSEVGEYDKAEDALQRAKTIQEEALQPNHPDLAFTVCMLAEAQVHLRRYGTAKAGFERALLMVASQGSGEWEVGYTVKLRALYNLGVLHHNSKNKREANDMWTQAVLLAKSRDALTSDWERATLASALLQLGRIEEATPIASELIASGYRDSEFLSLCLKHGLPATGPKENKRTH